jgi:hypothetical protein
MPDNQIVIKKWDAIFQEKLKAVSSCKELAFLSP